MFFAVIIALALGYFMVNRDKGPDENQIVMLIERGRQAIEKKSIDTAASCISKNYADESGMKYDQLRMIIADAFRSNDKYEVTVDTPIVKMDGADKALANAHVVITTVQDGERAEAFSGDVSLFLTKESVRKYLIFPTHEWKITGIGGIESIINIAQ